MSVNKATEVAKEIKPFVMGWLRELMAQSKSTSGNTDPYAIILYDESGQKKRMYSFSADGLAAALAAAVSGDVVWLPAGTITALSGDTYTPGEEISTGAIPVTSQAGVEISGLSVGQWYAVEGWNGYFKIGVSYSQLSSNFNLSDGSVFSGNVGQYMVSGSTPEDRTQSPSFCAYSECFDGADGKRYGRTYFMATTSSVWIRANDEPGLYGDNTGTLSWRLRNATFLGSITIPSGIEVVGLGKNSIIDGSVVNEGKITGLTVTGAISGAGKYLCYDAAGQPVTNQPIDMGGEQINNLAAPTADQDAATKKYADDLPPNAHAISHQSGGADAIKLDDLAAPDDNTDLNATTSKHGLLSKLPGDDTYFLNGTGGWSIPAGGGEGGGAFYPQHVLAMIDQFEIIAGGGSFTRAVRTSQTYAFYAYPSTATDGDAIRTTICVDAGTYNVFVLGVKDSNRGKINWAMDGTNFITGQDWYASSTQYNTILSGEVAILTSGRHVLTSTVNGKNASSSGYAMTITAVWLHKQ
jgi:hypothetical protein